MIAGEFPGLTDLSLEEKRRLLDELCADIASVDRGEPDPELVQLLEERWHAHRDDPSGAVTLEEVRKRIGPR